jgi:hydroxyacyl-ACP dehydratase HTD2-like protein with hotdog domain
VEVSLLTAEIMTWKGRREEPVTVEVTRRDIVKYAIATEQVRACYRSGDEAPPMFVSSLFRPVVPMEDLQPDGLPPMAAMPDLPLKRRMAGGIRMTLHRTVHPGDTLTGIRTLTDIFEKQGRQGPLIFVVHTLNVTDAAGAAVLDEAQTRIAR